MQIYAVNFQVAPWCVDNPYIHYGYRPGGISLYECFKSAFRLHNETFNIWSHVFGAAWFSRRLVRAYTTPGYRHGYHELHFASSIWLCAVSAVAHTFCNHSEKTWKRLYALDRASISVHFLTLTFSLGMVHYQRFPRLQLLFAVFCGFVGAATIKGSGSSAFSADVHKARSRSLQLLGLQLSLIALPLSTELRGSKRVRVLEVVNHYTPRGLLFTILGGLTYACQWPERWFPCMLLDYFGNGHNLMHMLVLIGMTFGTVVRSLTVLFLINRNLILGGEEI